MLRLIELRRVLPRAVGLETRPLTHVGPRFTVRARSGRVNDTAVLVFRTR